MHRACDLVIPPLPIKLSNSATEAEKEVIPPLPPKLPKSATEAEKQERAALVRERKRCQDAVNHGKRPKGAERSKERIGAVAASNSERPKGAERSQERIGAVADLNSESNAKRAKSEDADGHRDNAVANTIRRGRAEFDPWPWNGKGTKVCDNGDIHTGEFKHGSLFNGSFKIPYHGIMYVPQIVIALLSVQISFVYRFVFRFTGNMREGRWDGHGTQKFPNGDVLTGVYTDGESYCRGIRVFSDGQKYMPTYLYGNIMKKLFYFRLLGTKELSKTARSMAKESR